MENEPIVQSFWLVLRTKLALLWLWGGRGDNIESYLSQTLYQPAVRSRASKMAALDTFLALV